MPLLLLLSLLLLAVPARAQEVLVVFAAQTPASALAVSREGSPGALVAAETECRVAARGANCREALRVAAGCGALVHGARDARLIRGLPFTPDIPVAVRTTATAPTRDVAEREALAECRRRDRDASCIVAFAGCISPR